jgi:integrase
VQAQRNEQEPRRKLPTGIDERHSRRCAAFGGGKCDCVPSYRAWVFDVRTRSKVRKTFAGKGALAAAKRWRRDAQVQIDQGRLVAPTRKALYEVSDEWLDGAKAGRIMNRSGNPYKPSALRGYESDLVIHVLPELGGARLSDIRRANLQRLVERLLGRGLSASKVRNVIVAVQVVYRYAMELDLVAANPTSGLRLPNGVGSRDRAASPQEAADLLAALPDELRLIYATAFYAGMRRGELMALRWEDVSLSAGTIHVHRAWDEVAGEVGPKSEKGVRQVPVIALLRDYLAESKADTGRNGPDFVFGPKRDRPFTPSHVGRTARKAWAAENARRTEEAAERGETPTLLVPIGLHECRHTFVTLMHEAGVSLEEIGDLVGHSSTYMTDRYRHLRDERRHEAARKLDEYLAWADTRTRIEQVEADRREG